MLIVKAASSLIHEGAEHSFRLRAFGFARSLAVLPTGLFGKAVRRAGLRGPQRNPVDHTTALCELTRHITQVDMHREPGEQLSHVIAEAFALEAVAIFDMDINKTYTAGEWFTDPADNLHNICMFERSTSDPETGLISEVLRIGTLPIGSLLLRGEIERPLISSIANLIATTFDRYHSRANLSRVESAREVERLRSTVLDSLAHTYKTPLTAIHAAATGVIEIGRLSRAQEELMTVIEEQTAVLNELTMRLLTTARLEGHDILLRLDAVALGPLVKDAVSALHSQYPGLQLDVSIVPGDIKLICDRGLITALLEQYLDNAAKYSEFGSPVTVQVKQEGETLLLSVHNIGPIIPRMESERIFERYVRGSATATATPGTGIGLSIARAAAQAHGGDVWVKSSADEGTTFWASLPIRRNSRE